MLVRYRNIYPNITSQRNTLVHRLDAFLPYVLLLATVNLRTFRLSVSIRLMSKISLASFREMQQSICTYFCVYLGDMSLYIILHK